MPLLTDDSWTRKKRTRDFTYLISLTVANFTKCNTRNTWNMQKQSYNTVELHKHKMFISFLFYFLDWEKGKWPPRFGGKKRRTAQTTTQPEVGRRMAALPREALVYGECKGNGLHYASSGIQNGWYCFLTRTTVWYVIWILCNVIWWWRTQKWVKFVSFFYTCILLLCLLLHLTPRGSDLATNWENEAIRKRTIGWHHNKESLFNCLLPDLICRIRKTNQCVFIDYWYPTSNVLEAQLYIDFIQ